MRGLTLSIFSSPTYEPSSLRVTMYSCSGCGRTVSNSTRGASGWSGTVWISRVIVSPTASFCFFKRARSFSSSCLRSASGTSMSASILSMVSPFSSLSVSS